MIFNDNRLNIFRAQYRVSIKKELVRKSIHICSAIIPTLLFFSYSHVIITLCAILALYIFSEILRTKGIELPFIAYVTKIAARKRDENKIVVGPITLVLGIIFTAILWSGKSAQIGIYALAFGDGLASLSGKLFGKLHIPFAHGKTVAGSLTCFFAAFVSSMIVCKNVKIALILAVIAMVVEIIPLGDFDNLIIPILIGGIANYLLP